MKEKECGCVTMTWSQERVRQVVCRQDRAQHDKVSSSLYYQLNTTITCYPGVDGGAEEPCGGEEQDQEGVRGDGEERAGDEAEGGQAGEVAGQYYWLMLMLI